MDTRKGSKMKRSTKVVLSEELLKAAENYEVKKDGTIINRKTGHIIKPRIYDPSHYAYMGVYMGNGITRKLYVHRLIAYVHCPNPDKLPQVNHIDGNRFNNVASNLEWCSASYNVRDGFKRGRVIYNTGTVGRPQIFHTCEKYPRQIFWLLRNRDFEFAKTFFGTERVGVMKVWQEELQNLVLSPDPIKYLKDYAKEHNFSLSRFIKLTKGEGNI